MQKDCMEVQAILHEMHGIASGEPPDDASLQQAQETVWNTRVGKCPRSANQVCQRLYRAVCRAWPRNVIPRPPKIHHTGC